jgi:hypothetical protein
MEDAVFSAWVKIKKGGDIHDEQKTAIPGYRPVWASFTDGGLCGA